MGHVRIQDVRSTFLEELLRKKIMQMSVLVKSAIFVEEKSMLYVLNVTEYFVNHIAWVSTRHGL
ncbi:MAG: hypothetical protein ACFFCX_01485 [Candidatus Sifarchaeia archaeon]